MPKSTPTPWYHSNLVTGVLVGFSYLICARLSLVFIVEPEKISAFWPPTGYLLSLYLILAKDKWLSACLGAFPANMAANMLVGKPIWVASGFALGDTFVPLAGAWWLTRLLGNPVQIRNLRDILYITLIGGVSVSAGCAFIGSYFAIWGLNGASFWLIWLAWWTSDLTGVIAITPVFLSWYAFGWKGVRNFTPNQWIELILLLSGFLLCTHLVFRGEEGPLRTFGPLPFLLTPFLIWSAIRFGVHGASLICLILTALGVTYTFHGYGPFAASAIPITEVLFRMQVIMTVAILSTLLVAATVEERNRAIHALSESERLYRNAIEVAGAVPYYEVYARKGYEFVGEGISRLAGVPASEFSQELLDSLTMEIIPTGELSGLTIDEAIQKARHGEGISWTADYHLRLPDGTEKWLANASIQVRDENGEAIASLGILEDITDRKLAEQALRESERLYRTTIEGIGAVPYYRNYDSEVYNFLGAGIENLTGYSAQEFTPVTLGNIILERIFYGGLVGLDRDEAVHKVRMEAGAQWRADYRIRTKGGGERWLADSAVQVGDANGKPIGSLGILQDITERVRAEESLRLQDRAIISAVNGIIITDWTQPDNPVVFVNPAFEKITGYSAEEVIGKNLRFLQSDDLDQPGAEILRQAIQNERETDVVLRNYRKDGSQIWVELSIAPVHDMSGKVTHFIGIQNDITERVRMEEQQTYLTNGLMAVVDMADELLTCPDEDTISRRAVELAREKLGLERCSLQWFESQTLVGTYGTDRHGNTVDERNCRNPLEDGWMDNLKRQSGANLQWYYFEGEHVEYDGKELVKFGEGWIVFTPLHSNQKWVGAFFNDSAISGAPYDPIQQELVAVFCSLLANIIERRRSEEARHKLESQIHHAQKLESLGVLAGGIAHDFNNLLMGVLGNASLALAELPPESPARESVTHIEQAALRAAELAKQMLAYSGKGKFIIQRLNLSRIVEEMSHLLQVSISKKVFLRYNFASNLPSVEGDPTQIRQVIMNLITNASDAVGDRSGIITISTGALYADTAYLSESYLDDDLPEGYYVYVEVSDTGCGMDEETRSKIFDPFFTTKFTGRGLGLAATLGIVRGHKGAIKVYSEVGKGTTIKILFPACELPEDEPEGQEAKLEEDWKPSGTILLVDDEESVRVVCRRILESRGFQVLTANDGRTGVDLFRKEAGRITLVILDMTMPHMDGEEAFRELRRIRSDVRVILTSGYSEQDAIGRFAGKGLAGFIQKPFLPSALLEKIREALKE